MSHAMTTETELELNFLRAAHAALDEKIISGVDYAEIKNQFVKTQQVRAGVEAGVLGNEEHNEVRQVFLSAFVAALQSSIAGGGHNNQRARNTRPTAAHSTHAVPAGFTAKRLDKKPVFKPEEPKPVHNTPIVRPQGNASENQNGIKVDVPELGGEAASDKTSMSGIKVHKDTINLYNYVKAKRAHKWMTYRLNEAGMELVVSDVGAPDSTYEEFVMAFPENECRYGVFDWEYVNKDDEIFQKLIFVHWAPNIASVKNKMMYASTKDFFKGFLDGISVEVQATDPEELQEDVVYEAVRATIVRK